MSLIGKKIEEFSAKAYHQGKFIDISLSDLEGKWSAIVFYPADFTFVCPTELSELADLYEQFQQAGCEIYSVSTDTHFVHQAWAEASPLIAKIKYPMLGDPSLKIAKEFGVLMEEEGLALRGSFIVNPDCEIVAYEIHHSSIGRNGKELLRKVKAAQYVNENQNQACPASWMTGDEALTLGE